MTYIELLNLRSGLITYSPTPTWMNGVDPLGGIER